MEKKHLLLTLLILIAGLLILLVFVSIRSQSDDATTTLDITNAAPTITNPVIATTSFGPQIADGVNLTELSSTTLYFHGSFTDENGCEDVADDTIADVGYLGVNFYRESIGAFDCDPDTIGFQGFDVPRQCYVGVSNATVGNGNIAEKCTITNCTFDGNDTTGNYECVFDIEFFADATDVTSSPDFSAEQWNALAFINDHQSEGASNASTTVEMNTLLAIDLSGGTTINYGVLSLNATSSPVTLEVRNSGNYASTDLAISGTHMPCDLGTLATSSQRFSSTSEDYEDMILSLSSSSQDIGLSIYKQITSTTQATSNTYWTLTTPSTGVLGTCSGTNTIQAAL